MGVRGRAKRRSEALLKPKKSWYMLKAYDEYKRRGGTLPLLGFVRGLIDDPVVLWGITHVKADAACSETASGLYQHFVKEAGETDLPSFRRRLDLLLQQSPQKRLFGLASGTQVRVDVYVGFRLEDLTVEDQTVEEGEIECS